MRQQQQRSRNRNRGRKSTNPLSRNFESNGPDVKIRGNANHIAEKYGVLARDALTSGDTVMAENYFQHAEHYFRIIAATQHNNPQAATQSNSQRETGRESGDKANEASKNTSNEGGVDSRGDGPQPDLGEVPAEVALKEENTAVNEVRSENSNDASDKEERSRTRRNGRRAASTRRTARVAPKKDDDSSSSDGKPAEGLSKDAALLPSSLIGKSNEGDSASQTSEE